MVMPAHPRTYFVMVQPDLTFARAEQLLGAMPPAMDRHQRRSGNLRRGVRQRVPAARLYIHRADDNQTFASADSTVLVFGLHPRLQGPDHFRSFGAGSQMNLTPARSRLGLSPG